MNKLLTLTVASVGAIILGSGTAAACIDKPKTNHPSYWGDKCTKTEMTGVVKQYTALESGIKQIIVKGGPGYVVYKDGYFKNLKAPLNKKNGKHYDISHIIVCKHKNVEKEEPKQPVQPEQPVVPETPEKPVQPNDPEGVIEETPAPTPETPNTNQVVEVVETPEAGKGAPAQLPAELPKTGADSSLASMFTIVTGFSVLVSLIGYKGALIFLSNRLN